MWLIFFFDDELCFMMGIIFFEDEVCVVDNFSGEGLFFGGVVQWRGIMIFIF